MIEFQTAPRPDTTDLRVMLEEAKRAHDDEFARVQQVKNHRDVLLKDVKRAENNFLVQKKKDRMPKIALHAILAPCVVAIPVFFTTESVTIAQIAGVMSLGAVLMGGAIAVGWAGDETRNRKKQAIAARKRLDIFDASQKEVGE